MDDRTKDLEQQIDEALSSIVMSVGRKVFDFMKPLIKKLLMSAIEWTAQKILNSLLTSVDSKLSKWDEPDSDYSNDDSDDIELEESQNIYEKSNLMYADVKSVDKKKLHAIVREVYKKRMSVMKLSTKVPSIKFRLADNPITNTSMNNDQFRGLLNDYVTLSRLEAMLLKLYKGNQLKRIDNKLSSMAKKGQDMSGIYSMGIDADLRSKRENMINIHIISGVDFDNSGSRKVNYSSMNQVTLTKGFKDKILKGSDIDGEEFKRIYG